MRHCLLIVWAAAARAEYFDVEEDAFWENDGPQEPRKTVKPKTCLLYTSPSPRD